MYYVCIMKLEKTNAQMRKGVLELCILSIISTKEVYSSNVLSSLKEAQLLVVEGTIYPLLTRLKNDGLLSYRWEEYASGPPRKYYKLTSEGEGSLIELNTSWLELTESVETILNNKN